MISKTTTIVNPQGFHMRPASLMTAEAAKYASTITLVAGGKEIPANSLMAIMAAGIKCGDEVEVRAEGADEAAAVDGIVAFIESGMGD
ncbi:MAG: HPr family phosphocarrier protein [Denitrobacterium sp.]|jgi:phosphocarrier protein HPr|nr:HPr family phosphocarrier protein [Denitrobacterium sp.]